MGQAIGAIRIPGDRDEPPRRQGSQASDRQFDGVLRPGSRVHERAKQRHPVEGCARLPLLVIPAVGGGDDLWVQGRPVHVAPLLSQPGRPVVVRPAVADQDAGVHTARVAHFDPVQHDTPVQPEELKDLVAPRLFDVVEAQRDGRSVAEVDGVQRFGTPGSALFPGTPAVSSPFRRSRTESGSRAAGFSSTPAGRTPRCDPARRYPRQVRVRRRHEP